MSKHVRLLLAMGGTLGCEVSNVVDVVCVAYNMIGSVPGELLMTMVAALCDQT